MISEIWSKFDPGFLAPIWLLVGLVAVVAILLLELGSLRRRKQAVRLFASPHLLNVLTGSVSPAKRLIKRVLLVSAVGLLFITMARPYLFYDWLEESRTGLDILMAIDCSKSMLTEDVKPNRMERAKLAMSDFAEQVPDDRLGLITFAGDSFLQCPLTLDHEAFQDAVREVDTDSIPRPGTDIATAINEALLALQSQPNNLKILVLVTDGEDLEGRDIDAAKQAKQAGLKIYTVGVGTPEGGIIPERDDSGAIMYHHDASGEIVQSRLDEANLRKIADITGGAYVPLGQRGEGLQEIYDRYIAPLPKHNFEERKQKVHIERFEWPLGLAILLLVIEFILSERARNKPPVVTGPVRQTVRRRNAKKALAATPLLALSLLLLGVPGSARASSTDTAERDYKSGKYEDALQNYRDAANTQPNRKDIQFDRGDAAYKSGDYSEAEEAFRRSLETPDLNLQEGAYYNLGNAQFKHGESFLSVDKKKTISLWEQALKSYDSSLKLKTTADARHNYEVVKKRLEDLKQQQQQQQQNDQQQNQQQQDKQNQSNDSKQSQDKGQGSQQQNQQGQGQTNPQNGQNPSQSQQQQGNQSGQDKLPGAADQDKNGQQPSSADKPGDAQKHLYSQGRDADKEDPGVKSRQEAADLLDSLKDEEHHVNATSLNSNNQPPPPPPSGKDW